MRLPLITLLSCVGAIAATKVEPQLEKSVPFDRLVNGIGDELPKILHNISAHASSLRNGTKCSLEGFYHGYNGLVKKVIFDDGVTWAAKISAYNTILGVDALRAVEKYCPFLPVPRIHGEVESAANSRVKFYLMDWLDGVSLYEDSEFGASTIKEISPHNDTIISYKVELPQQVIPQLAEFVYNLTTCPIPRAHSTFTLFWLNDSGKNDESHGWRNCRC